MNLEGRTALITGAGRGIGLGCAIELARRGARIVINDRPGSPDLASAQRELSVAGDFLCTIEEDVFDREGCEHLVERALEQAGRIDILISNPAINERAKFADYEPETFDRVIQGTLVGGFHISQLASRHMIERGGGGKIVFISSVHAVLPYTSSVAYNAAKAGLNHMMRTIATELLEHRINVNAIEPGWIDTQGERDSFGDHVVDTGATHCPWGRLGQPEDIGRAAAFLSSDDADYVTGTVLRVDGGFVLKDCFEDL